MEKRKSSPGRPKLPVADTKATPVQVRMGEAEKAGFKAAADVAGLSLSAWMRVRLRDAACEELRRAGKQVPFLSYSEAVDKISARSEPRKR